MDLILPPRWGMASGRGTPGAQIGAGAARYSTPRLPEIWVDAPLSRQEFRHEGGPGREKFVKGWTGVIPSAERRIRVWERKYWISGDRWALP